MKQYWRCHTCNEWVPGSTLAEARQFGGAGHLGHLMSSTPRDWNSVVDVVNRPPHYTSGTIECIDAIQSALTEEEFRGFLKGNIIKYTWREKHKGGDESLKKAQWYLERLLNANPDDKGRSS